ncbi:hypothetical protein [Methylobacterium brachiatum]|uniref:hypothetical protein n=1 Tax=Methylobacterium brachiatum TaxID=269660 RepID=UPI00244A1F07|nr:hypothetical protein [Methylobacterium brachiatum]MDH2311422.1 hypothetical protein [Methylobacterium brachiatum]
MATPRPQPGDTAATLQSINALCDAVDALFGSSEAIRAIQSALGVIQAAISPLSGLESNVDTINKQITYLAQLISNEDGYRSSGDRILQEQIDQRAGKDETIKALGDLRASLQTLSDLMAARRFELLSASLRPGDAPLRYTSVSFPALLIGDPTSLVGLAPQAVAGGDSGRVVRTVGQAVIGQRDLVAIEPGRAYAARYAVQRRANPSDPANDAVVLGITWLGAGLRVLPVPNGRQVVEEIDNLLTSAGRQERVVLFSRSPVPDAQFRAPPMVRYARAYVQMYGPDGVTDVEILGITDVTEATVLAPETADTVQRVAELESQDAGRRLGVLEANANAPNSITLATKSDAATATIPATVTTVALRGRVQPGDGGDGLYVRISGSAAPSSDCFVNQGTTFVRVFMSSDVLGALLLSLPQSDPGVPGKAFLNGSLLAVSL